MLPGNISSRFCNRVHWRWEAKIQEYLTSVLARASSSVFNWLLLDRAKFISTGLNVTEQDLDSVWFLLPNSKSSAHISMLVSMLQLALLSSGILRWNVRKKRCYTHSSTSHSRITDFITGYLGLQLKLIALHESPH